MRGRWPSLHALFFLSGAAALIFQIAWFEGLRMVFGHTATAAAANLVVLFLGLAAGARVLGGFAPRLARPVLVYGLLELLVALLGGAGALMVAAYDGLHGVLWERLGAPAGMALRLGVALLVLGPASFAMGGTFPVLVEAAVREGRRLGWGAGLLYGANALGAVLGGLLAAFHLLPALGTRATHGVAAAIAALAGLLAIALGRSAAASPRPGTPPPPPRSQGVVVALAFAAGFLGLALEVLFVRLFAIVLPGSVHAYALVVAMFLLGLALGGAGAAGLSRRSADGRLVLRVLLAAAGVSIAFAGPLFRALTDGLLLRPPGRSWDEWLARTVVEVGAVVLLPAALLGAVFPALLRHLGGAGGPGAAVGRVTAWNTVGAAAGAGVAGFVLLEHLGIWVSLGLVAVGASALGRFGVGGRGGRLADASLALTALALVFAAGAPSVRLGPGERLLALREGPGGVVAVVEDPDGARKLRLDGHRTLGGSADSRWEALQAHLPLALHPAPRRVAFLGLGTGITAGAALHHPVERVMAVELLPDVVALARAWFAADANGLFADPRAEVVVDDARHFVRAGPALDVVVGDLFFPFEAGAASLYTREHFARVRERLSPDGLFAQWLPLFQLAPEEFLGIARTFVEAFPETTLWRGDFFADRPLVALVGRRAAAPLDPDRLTAALGPLDDPLGRDAGTVPFHLYAGNLGRARHLVARGRILTDDLPWIQYAAPRSERRRHAGERAAFVGDRLLAFEEALHAAVPGDQDPFLGACDRTRRRLVRAGLALRQMAVHLARGRRDGHREALLAYVRLVPAEGRPDLADWLE
jgi:spermidine synthase